MTVRGTASYNPMLTTYGQGVAQDMGTSVADFIAPRVIVPAGAGQYKEYSSKNAFQQYITARALGGPATRIQFAADDKTFNCMPNALEIPIDDDERDKAGEVGDAQQRLEESKVKTLVSSAVLAREIKVVDLVAAISAVSGVGTWSSADADPIEEIDEVIADIALNGIMPNRIVFGMGAWRVLRHHPKVIARQPGSANIGLTTEQLKGMLVTGDLDIRVAAMAKDTAKLGKDKSASFVVGSACYIFRGDDNPTQYDPSAVKTFSTTGSGVDAVRVYRDESARSDVAAVDWSEDIKLTASAMIKKITVA